MQVDRPVVIDGGTGDRSDVLEKVKQLTSISTPCDSHPNIHAAPEVINYICNINSSFCDRNAFSFAMAKYLEEGAEQAEMINLMEQGHSFACMLYTWRSCTMPIAQVKEPVSKMEMLEKTLEILQPEIQKIKEFIAFQQTASKMLEKEVTRLCHQRTEFVSEAHLLTLGKFISMLATLDELKNSKASIRNDYSYFKRASEQFRRDPSAVSEMHDVSMFLATHNVILTQVKAVLSRISGFEDVFCNIINTCISWYEQKLHILPDEKYTIVKVIGFLLYLIDGNQINLCKLKQLNLSKIDTIFKEMEVVPLFGDIVIGPFNYVQKLPNFDRQYWPKCLDGTASRQSTLINNMTVYRQQHADMICELMAYSTDRNKLVQTVKLKSKLGEDDLTADEASARYNTTVKGLRLLATWTSNVAELFSWKLLHPADAPQSAPETPEPEIYERATRHNYSNDEKSALAELVGMVKSVQSLMQRLESVLSRAIFSHIYHQLQDFVHNALNEPLRKAEKHHKEVIKSILLAVKNVCVDMAAVIQEPAAAGPAQKKKSKSNDPSETRTLALKATRPSYTQLYLMRTMLESLVEKGEKSSKNRHPPRKDINQQHILLIEKFLQDSFFWTNLMDLQGSLQVCGDLSQLWYREFYLEMTKGGRLQFPIEMSMPWILMSHLLDSKDTYLIQHILYPLDLYNDSAQCALHLFKKQFLYDEIEAEVRLCFDQLIYKVSEHIYEYYRTKAALMLLNRTFRSECTKLKAPLYIQRPVNYVSLMQQRNIRLLGRTVDLQQLIGQRIVQHIIKSLEVSISRYELSGLTSILELESLIQVSSLTHRLLVSHLPLDSFESLFNEANVNVTSPYGRIAIATMFELTSHVFPHYCYNGSTERFVRTTLSFAEEEKREKLPTTAHYNLWGNKELTSYFMTIFSRYQGFIGHNHIASLIGVLGYQDVALLLKEISETIKTQITSTLVKYLTALQAVMPKRCIQPRFEYGSSGTLGYYQAQLTDIMTYADLQPKVFQCFREIGNALIIALFLQRCMCTKETHEMVLSGMFMHRFPVPFIPKKSDAKKTTDGGKTEGDHGPGPGPSSSDSKQQNESDFRQAMEQLHKKYQNYHVLGVMSKKGSEEQVKIVNQTNLLTLEKLSTGLSMYGLLLRRISVALNEVDSPVWSIMKTSGGSWDIQHSVEFHRLWSAMQFVFCRPTGANEFTVEELFGEGLNWAGCALVVLLGQQRRFEATDFCYHLMRIHRVTQAAKTADKPAQPHKLTNGVDLHKMIDRIRRFQQLNDEIFHILNKYLGASKDAVEHSYRVEIEHFEPPKFGDLSDEVTSAKMSTSNA